MRQFRATVVAAFTVILSMESCNTLVYEEGYIGAPDIRIEDGNMDEHVLLSLGRLSDPVLSPDGDHILYGISYISTAENKSCRNLYLCNTDGSGKIQLTAYAKNVSNARFSPDGKHIYFIQDSQIWEVPFLGDRVGNKTQVTDIKRGVSGFKISPDNSSILYISSIPGPVKSPSDIDPSLDKAKAYIADDLMYRHWDHWVCETPRSFVAPLGHGMITEKESFDILKGAESGIELPTEPFGGEEQLSWSPDSRHIAYSCRKLAGRQYAFSTNTDIFVYDLVSGLELRITDGGGYDTDPVWSPDGQHLAWLSMARDGYEADSQRILVADIEKDPRSDEINGLCISVKAIREVAGELDADKSGLVWSADSKYLYFNATVQAVGGIFRACAEKGDTNGTMRLTPQDWLYGFGPVLKEESTEQGSVRLISTYQSMMFPTELCSLNLEPLDSLGQNSVSNISNVNDGIIGQLAQIRQERVWLRSADGDSLHCWVLYPPQFDATGKYPAIEMLNGGPQTSLDQSWSYRWNFRLMASKGYVVILPNRHGDSGFGQAWKEQISGDYCGLNMKDYLTAAKYIRNLPYVGKLGAVGASYGGYSAYMMEGLQNGIFDCIISHAGIFSERDLWYTTEEMWFANWDNGGLMKYYYTPDKVGSAGDGITFGGIQQAGAPYALNVKAVKHYGNSPESMVTKWRTPILCIHGMMDFRIPYTQGMAAFNAARMMGVPARLVVFPEENHWVLQPQNALLWHHEFFDWLEKWTSENTDKQ